MQNFIQEEIHKLSSLLIQIQNDADLITRIEEIAKKCILALKNGYKILFAGNGGSAADAQHLAAELVVRLGYHRPGLAALALTTDTSALTAIGNDYSFEEIFSRQVQAIGQKGDVFIGISTSGKSKNILNALKEAKKKELSTICFTGANTKYVEEHCDLALSIPTTDTQKIQECHIMFGHICCSLIEESIFGANYNPLCKKVNEVA